MTTYAEARAGVADAPDWTPWGAPRRGERGVETAFHHPLILLRRRGDESLRVVAPGDVVAGAADGLEWSPMIWALRGRRLWRGTYGLGPGKVVGGAGDRLFMLGDFVCEQFFEGAGVSEQGATAWVEALARRAAWFDARGVVYRHLVIPDNHALHPEAFAGQPRLSPQRPLMRVLAQADPGLRARIVYPLEALVEAQARGEVCYPHDVHISGYGSYICYRELMASLPGLDRSRVAREADLQTREIMVGGDIARSVDRPGRRVELREPPAPPYRSLIKGGSYQIHQVDVYQSQEPNLPRLVLFRTSNSSRLMGYLMRHFSRLTAVASPSVFYDLVESERPDFVITEMPERYFASRHASCDETDRMNPPTDHESKFEALTGHALPLPQD